MKVSMPLVAMPDSGAQFQALKQIEPVVPATTQTVSLSRQIVIVGGGAAGLTVAALLRDRVHGLSITVVEPSEHHDYQSAWTLVGGGAYEQKRARRPQSKCIPDGVEWIRGRVVSLLPDANQLQLDDGRVVAYKHLVVALGLQLNWQDVDGLQEALGSDNVTSNFRYDLAPYTWNCVREFRGGRVLFTRPSMPMKCAAAAQNAMYLAADHFRRYQVRADLHYFTVGKVMHSVPYYHQALVRVAAHHGVTVHREHRLLAVDARNKTAAFEIQDGGTVRQTIERFDLLHVTPPQGPLDVIRNSALADTGGWLSVDPHTLRHTRYQNVFGLGDCTSTPNIKSVAAVRVQAPVLVRNLLAAIHGDSMEASYDGYGACPLTTSSGKVMLAESIYNGVASASFRADPRVPRRQYWWLKRHYLPHLYWRMLDGNLGLDWHAPRTVRGPMPEFVP
jgi:sulfide:quinone oxidoreductase